MRWLFVVRFRERKNGWSQYGNGLDDTKTYRVAAGSPKAAAQRMRKKGQIISVRKVKKIP